MTTTPNEPGEAPDVVPPADPGVKPGEDPGTLEEPEPQPDEI